MPGDQGVLGTIAACAAVAGLIYLVLRWLLAPTLRELPVGVEFVLDVAGAALLMPEFCCTFVLRRTINRPAPFAFGYGDAVGGAARAAQSAAGVLLSALHEAASRIGHREALIGAAAGTLALVLW